MTHVFKLFQQSTPSRRTAPCDITTHCAETVIRQLRADIRAMSPAELRGYVRARAVSVVRDYVRQTFADRELPPSRGDFIASTVDQIVHRVTCDLQAPIVIPMPAPHLAKRAA